MILGVTPQNSRKLDLTSHKVKEDQKKLLENSKIGILTKEIYNNIRPVSSQQPRMYGLPKAYKEDLPL